MNWKKHKLPALLMLMIVVYSCASMGTPDGGPYDGSRPSLSEALPSRMQQTIRIRRLPLNLMSSSN